MSIGERRGWRFTSILLRPNKHNGSLNHYDASYRMLIRVRLRVTLYTAYSPCGILQLGSKPAYKTLRASYPR